MTGRMITSLSGKTGEEGSASQGGLRPESLVASELI